MDSIAIVLPVYMKDNVSCVRQSLDSILNQTYTNTHLYIGVDGPVGEELKDCLQQYERDEHVDIEWFAENRGLARVLNDL